MKINTLLTLFLLGILSVGCDENPSDITVATIDTDTTTSIAPTVVKKEKKGMPVVINGHIDGMKNGEKVYFDKKTIDATEIVGSIPLDAEGNFSLDTRIPNPGVYRMRLGIKSIYMLLKGGETIDLTAKLDGYNIIEQSIKGSIHAKEMQKWAEEKDATKIANFIDKSTENKALLYLYLVEKLDITVYIDLYKKVRDQLSESYPNAPYTYQFNSKVLTVEAKLKSQPVTIGKEAPEINLPNPDGKKIALSSLRGKVVLLDFWASWCMPCRRTNPSVVALYQKYKKKGFDIYSVSFDGADDRRIAALGGPDKVKNFLKTQRSNWTKAIKDDKLTWKSHVSELRGWSSQVGKTYQVNGIPRTFLIDKKGLVRFDNLHAGQLEEAVKKLLNEK